MSDRRNELDELGRAREQGYLDQIERYRVLWANTGNPVHVWHAISCCFAIGMLREQGRIGRMPAPPWTEALPFPD